MVRLISGEGKSVWISSGALKESKTLDDMMCEFEDDGDLELPVPNVDTNVLEKIVDYCEYHSSHEQTGIYDSLYFSQSEDFVEGILLAAHYLDIESLVDLAAKEAAKYIEGKDTRAMKEFLGIESDEEEKSDEAHDEEGPAAS